jgi:succinate dehydrogenase/fumarate reductase flavoprotein subunit
MQDDVRVEGKSGFTRRDFLKGVAITGTAVAATSVTANLTGCMAEGNDATADLGTPAGSEKVTGDYQVSVTESDVLIVGAGLTGLAAARIAIGNGASVTIVDKGPWGHCGTSGINWGHDMSSTEWSADDGTSAIAPIAILNCGMPDQAHLAAMCKGVYEYRPNLLSEQLGGIVERDTEGNPVNMNFTSPFMPAHGCFPRYWAQDVMRLGAKVFERTRVLNVLLNSEGRAAGAVAIDVKTGDAYVFRAKTTILATGSYVWIAGNNGLYPRTISAPENVGDGHRMLIEAGLAMRDMEQQPVDFVQWDPLPVRQGMGTVGCSIVNHWMACDKDKNRLTEQYDTMGSHDGDGLFSNSEFMRVCLGAIHNGRGTEHDGILVDIRDLENPTNDRYYRTKRANEAVLGYELPDFVEACPEQWESAANPFDLGDNCETDIPGLYFATAGNTAWLGACYFAAQANGYLSGIGASKEAKSINAVPDVPWDKVTENLDYAYGVLNAEPAGGIRSVDLLRKVQDTWWQGLSPWRDEAGIQAAFDEFERIENEDLPHVYVPSKSKQYNMDWQKALDLKSLLACGKGTAQAALLRKETRGAHCRTDYPQMGGEEWLQNTKVQFRDGAWNAELVDIDDSLVPKSALMSMILNVGIES